MSQIRIVLTLDGKQYEAALNQAQAKTGQFGGSLAQLGTQASLMATALRAAGLSFAGLGATQIISAISKTGIAFEQMRQALASVSAGSGEAAQRFQFVASEAERLGLDIETAVQGYTRLAAATRGTSLEGAETAKIFGAVSEAAGKLGLSAADTSGVLRALGQIASKGTLSAEELRQQLGDRLPGAFQIAADAMGVTTVELNRMLVRGEIASEVFLPRFGQALRDAFGTDATTRIGTTQASFTRLTNEIKLAADEIASDLNPKLGAMAELLAKILSLRRQFQEGTGVSVGPPDLSFLGLTQSGLETAYEIYQRRQNQRPADSGIEAPFTTPGAGAIARIQGQFGARPGAPEPAFGGAMDPEKLSAKQQEKVDLLREELALLGMVTNEEKALWQVTQGRYSEESRAQKDLIVEIARAEDQKAARIEAEREAARGTKEYAGEQERLLLIEQRRNAEADDLIQGEMDRLALMQEEQRLGRAMTQSEQALFELRTGGYGDLTGAQRESLRLTLEQSAALERLGLVSGEVMPRMIEDQVSLADGMRDGLDDYLAYATDAYRQGLDLSNTFFDSFEDTLVRSLQTGKFAWRDFGDTVIAEINRIAVQTLVSGLIRNGIGLIAAVGSGGSSGPAANGPWAEIDHTGGIVGSGRAPMRQVPASLFAGAPRFHGGGMIGAGEVPIIAKRGEGVFTPEQMKAMGGTSIKIDYRPTIDARGADQAAMARMLDQSRRDLAYMEKSIYENLRRGNAPV